jgi:antitoxin component of MazEF toxin-antitoxin module
MSNQLLVPTIVVQREKNQITIPNDVAKKIHAQKGTKYKILINKNGNIELEVIKNDIRKYIGTIKTKQSALEIIQKTRQEDENSSQKVYKNFK